MGTVTQAETDEKRKREQALTGTSARTLPRDTPGGNEKSLLLLLDGIAVWLVD